MTDLVAYFKDRSEKQLDLLRFMVEHETPTSNKALNDKLSKEMHKILSEMGAEITVHPRQVVGDIRIARWNKEAEGKPILILCHLDTVWAEGTIKSSVPMRQDENLFYGPGALDMKAGIVVGIDAIRGLQELGELPNRPIWVALTTDEETGSVHSKELIMELAQEAGLVLVMEPAAENEAVKTWRKGVARYWVRSRGLASHSGNAPEAGINAIIDCAHQAIKINELSDLPNGTSVAVTQFKGGVAMNVIPPEAELYADVRFLKKVEYERVNQAIRQVESTLPGASVEVTGYLDRPPMERDDQMLATYSQAKMLAERLGLTMTESGSGGGSDGNFTAGMGVPTLDGMGPEGKGLHALHEQVQLRSIPRRAALIASILRDWQMP